MPSLPASPQVHCRLPLRLFPPQLLSWLVAEQSPSSPSLQGQAEVPTATMPDTPALVDSAGGQPLFPGRMCAAGATPLLSEARC